LVSGNPRKAIPEFKAELSIFKYFSAAEPANAQARVELSSAYLDLGAAWLNVGNTRTGLQFIQNGIEIAEQRPVTDPGVAGMLASGYIDQGEAFEKMKDAPRALSAYTKAEKLFESPALFKPGNFADTLQAAAGGKIAGALTKLGKLPQADEKYRSALRQVEPAASAIPPNLRAQYIRADLFAGLGDLLSRRAARGGAEAANAWREAGKCYEKSLEAWQRLPLRTATASILFDITAPKTIARNLALCKHAIEQLEDTDSRPVISPELPAALHKARKSRTGVAKNISD
jgi:tetratricopeptide (TPR) repeat protein